MRTTTNVARTVVAAWILLMACMGSKAAAQDTKVGFAVGAAVPATGIGIKEIGPSLSGWVARPIGGPFNWRVEVGGARLQMSDSSRFRCAAAGLYCDVSLDVASLTGGVHLEPRAEKAIAPYGYVTLGLYRLSASAEALDLHEGSIQESSSWTDNAFGIALGSGIRIRLSGRTAFRAELRYSGFHYKPETQHWASLLTPSLTTSVAF